MVDEIREGSPHATKSLENFERFQDFQNIMEYESDNSDEPKSPYKDTQQIQEENEWLGYLAKPNRETIMNMPPQLDLAYHEFKRLLQEENVHKSFSKF